MGLGLGTLIYGAALAISGTKRAIKNADSKANSQFVLPNGVRYWVDVDGQYKLMDGTVIMWKSIGTDHEKVIDVKTNRVIYDRWKEVEAEKNALASSLDKDDDIFFLKINQRCYGEPLCFFEKKTGKQVAKYEKKRVFHVPEKKYEYFKYYFYDFNLEGCIRRHPELKNKDMSYFKCMVQTSTTTHKFDEPIRITEEEFNKAYEEFKNKSGIGVGRIDFKIDL